MRFRQEIRTGEQETFRPAATTSRTWCCAQRLLATRHNSGSGTSERRRGRAANQCRQGAMAPMGPFAQYRGSDLKLAAALSLPLKPCPGPRPGRRPGRNRAQIGVVYAAAALGRGPALLALRTRYLPGPARNRARRPATRSSRTRSSAPKAASRSLSTPR